MQIHGECDSSFSTLCGGLGIGSLGFSLFGVSSVLPYSVLELSCWKGCFGKRSNGEIWKAVRSCLMWCLQREKDACCFEGKEVHPMKLKFLFFKILKDWTSTSHTFSIVDFLKVLGYLQFSLTFIVFLLGLFLGIFPVYLGCVLLCLFFSGSYYL